MSNKSEATTNKRDELKRVIISNLEKSGIKISKKPLDIILDTVEKFEK